MKTNPPHDADRRSPLHAAHNFLAALVITGAVLWLGSLGCSLVGRPDSQVKAGIQTSTRVAAPISRQNITLNAPDIHARSGIMIDALSGETLYEKNADLKLPVASTQKLLTALEVIEEGDLERELTVSILDALEPPSKVGLQPGAKYRKIDLLGSMLVASANDAASALASNGNGSRDAFLKKMNNRAKWLGAKNSVFRNAHGLDEPGQYSTARDSAIIAYHAYRSPLIRHFAAQLFWAFPRGDGESTILENTNDLLWNWPPYFNGLKGGFTFSGGKCLVASAKHNGSEIIIVLLGSTADQIFRDAKRLFQWHHGRLKKPGDD
ncbi:MAG: D-alanyl-D-alanine carboxypeptidase family protein [Terrimicrobiaceae bacterium]